MLAHNTIRDYWQLTLRNKYSERGNGCKWLSGKITFVQNVTYGFRKHHEHLNKLYALFVCSLFHLSVTLYLVNECVFVRAFPPNRWIVLFKLAPIFHLFIQVFFYPGTMYTSATVRTKEIFKSCDLWENIKRGRYRVIVWKEDIYLDPQVYLFPTIFEKWLQNVSKTCRL